jgi:cytochrome c peroxidase
VLGKLTILAVIVLASLAALAACRGAEDASCDRNDAARLVVLGRTPFFDHSLCADGTMSCATCHRPELDYTGGRAHAAGVSGRSGTRDALGLVDVCPAAQSVLGWPASAPRG